MLLVLVTVAVETTVVNVMTTNIITMVQDFLSNLCLLELIDVRFCMGLDKLEVDLKRPHNINLMLVAAVAGLKFLPVV